MLQNEMKLKYIFPFLNYLTPTGWHLVFTVEVAINLSKFQNVNVDTNDMIILIFATTKCNLSIYNLRNADDSLVLNCWPLEGSYVVPLVSILKKSNHIITQFNYS